MPNTNEPANGTASTVEHVGGIVTGAAIGYAIAGGLAAVASTVTGGLLAPVAIAVTPGLGAVIGGWIGHKATAPSAPSP